MNQFLKNKILEEEQKPLIEAKQSQLSFMTDQEISSFTDNIILHIDKFTNDPFVVGRLNNDGTMTMEDIKIFGEIKQGRPILEVQYINSDITKSFNQYTMPVFLNEVLVTRSSENEGYFFPKHQKQIAGTFELEGTVNENLQGTFELNSLNNKLNNKKNVIKTSKKMKR